MSKEDDIQLLRNNASTALRNNDSALAGKYTEAADFLAQSPAVDDNASAKITSAILSNDSDLAAENVAAIAQQILAGQPPGPNDDHPNGNIGDEHTDEDPGDDHLGDDGG